MNYIKNISNEILQLKCDYSNRVENADGLIKTNVCFFSDDYRETFIIAIPDHKGFIDCHYENDLDESLNRSFNYLSESEFNWNFKNDMIDIFNSYENFCEKFELELIFDFDFA